MLANAKARAKANEIPFSITIADVVIPDVCPVLGIPIRTKGGRENAPSLDKVIPSLGYTTGNVRVISMRANRLKSDATPEELRALAEYVETHQAGRTNNAVP